MATAKKKPAPAKKAPAAKKAAKKEQTKAAAVITAPHVFTAIEEIAAIFRDVGMDKTHSTDNLSFKFRGIDDVMQALSSLQIDHKVRIIPRFTDATHSSGVTRQGYPVNYTRVKGTFEFRSTVDGSSTECVMFGEAADTGDKSTSKAQSIAYKYAAFQVFCIPLKGVMADPDQNTYEFKAPADDEPQDQSPPPEDDTPAVDVLIEHMREALSQCGTAESIMEKAKTFKPQVDKLPEAARDMCRSVVKEMMQQVAVP